MIQKYIIDTDCGSDDAMAIAMALREPKAQILMFSTVHGNVSAPQAALNTLTTIERAATYQPPVYVGVENPLLRESCYAYETHGNDGMGDLGFKPQRLTVSEGYAVFKIIECIDAAEQDEIEIITLGTLTNIAIAMRIAPRTMRKVKRISMMGSSGLGKGNVSPVAEFNIWQDAEAASIVFNFGVPILAVGWDACLGEAMLSSEDIRKIAEGSELGKFTIDCNRQLLELNRERFGYDVLDMADPSAMAAILYPECIQVCDPYYCEVDISRGPSYGSLLVYDQFMSSKPPNARVCSRLHPERFKEYLYQRLCGERAETFDNPGTAPGNRGDK